MPTVFDDLKANKIWKCPEKGLRKETISISQEISIGKPNDISICSVKLSNIVNETGLESNYLNAEASDTEIEIKMGDATTPVDCYLELFLQEMVITEKCICFINTKSGIEIMFTVQLLKTSPIKYYYELSVDDMFDLAVKYKENGVKMFSKYRTFAHNYFTKAAKCLLSYRDIESSRKGEIEKLLINVYANIAACLLKQSRFEEVVEILSFLNEPSNTERANLNEKAIYRKSLAHYSLKQYNIAKELLKKIDCNKNSEILALWNKICNDEKADNARYTEMVKRMLVLDNN